MLRRTLRTSAFLIETDPPLRCIYTAKTRLLLQTCFSKSSTITCQATTTSTCNTHPFTNLHQLSPKHSSFTSTYVLTMSQLAMKGSDTAPMLTALPVDQFLELPLRCTWRPQQPGIHGVVVVRGSNVKEFKNIKNAPMKCNEVVLFDTCNLQ